MSLPYSLCHIEAQSSQGTPRGLRGQIIISSQPNLIGVWQGQANLASASFCHGLLKHSNVNSLCIVCGCFHTLNMIQELSAYALKAQNSYQKLAYSSMV